MNQDYSLTYQDPGPPSREVIRVPGSFLRDSYQLTQLKQGEFVAEQRKAATKYGVLYQ